MSSKEVNSNYADQIATSVWTRIGIITIVTFTGVIWLFIKGPIPVIKGSTPLMEMVPFWYMILAFPILGMLVSDLMGSLFAPKLQTQSIELLLQLIIITLVSSVRLSLLVPLSGHTLLLGYFILRRILIGYRISNINKTELLLAFIILLVVSYFKLMRWSDHLTYFAGLGSGAVLALISFLFWRYNLWRTVKANTNY